jgi:protein-disulfide isomerase
MVAHNKVTDRRGEILKIQGLGLIAAEGCLAAAALGIAMGPGAGVGLAQAPAGPTPVVVGQPPDYVSAPSPAPTGPVDPFPQTNPKFFTASSPTTQTVGAFLHQVWGYDENRLWKVMAIQSTPAPGVSKVTVFVTDKTPNAQVQSMDFFITPDGKHAIGAGAGVVPFGAKPFEEARNILRERANGASRGASSKEFEMVEFADLQCPHCKEAQGTMDQIVKDFPKAHVVFQMFPLVDVHSSAFKAAAYGVCAQKQSDEAFFKYVAAVFDTQEALSPTTDDTVLRGAAMRAGLDGGAIAACSETIATKEVVAADIKLAQDVDVEQTPTLMVNGRPLPVTSDIPYDTLKKIIQYQATLDGVDSGATAETLAPKPDQPKLETLPK